MNERGVGTGILSSCSMDASICSAGAHMKKTAVSTKLAGERYSTPAR